MVRIVKEHDERRTELLDVAQELFLMKGYENVSVAAIIDDVGIAKGTFYHYFKSKEDLLDQIVERQSQVMMALAEPIFFFPGTTATEKLNRVFSVIGEYKAEHRDVMIMLVRALYTDENIILRHKIMKERSHMFTPILSKVIAEGVAEGVFDTRSPELTAQIILHIGAGLGEQNAEILLHEPPGSEAHDSIIKTCLAYEDATARILGISEGSIEIIRKDVIDTFFRD